MKTYSISSGPIKSEIILPRSKSYANRLLVLAALASKETVIADLPDVDDVHYLLECLKTIGVKVKHQGNQHYLFGGFPVCASSAASYELNVGEGGTTARFLAAMLALDHHEYTLHLSGKLSDRPWEELIQALTQLGARVELNGNKLLIQGPVAFKERELTISATRSTQFASALKLAYSNFVDIRPLGLSSSQSYWKLTEDLVEKFKTGSHFVVPADWSGASYPMCFAALTSEVFFPGLHYDLHQADAKLFDILNRLGAIKSSTAKGITVTPITKRAQSLKLDVDDCLDLVPALGFLLAHIEGIHELRGVKNLIHKESDRLSEMRKLLKQFSRKTEYQEDSDILIIYGSEEKILAPLKIETAPDHRLVMTASLFLKYHSGGDVAHPEAASKSFQSFFSVCGI